MRKMNNRLRLFLFLTLLSLDAFSQSLLNRTKPSGKSGPFIEREGYSLQYNSDCKIPHWVSYQVKDTDLIKAVKRTDDFRADSQISSPQAQLEDYRRSGYNRGHMARAGLFTRNKKVMSESFILSNIVPQDPYMNQNGAWRKLEDFEFKNIETQKEVFIVSGPVLDPNMQRIGPNEVCVPNYVFKVLYKNFPRPTAIAFVIPNFRTAQPYTAYAVSVRDLEKLTSLNFLSELTDSVEKEVEANFDLNNWTSF